MTLGREIARMVAGLVAIWVPVIVPSVINELTKNPILSSLGVFIGLVIALPVIRATFFYKSRHRTQISQSFS